MNAFEFVQCMLLSICRKAVSHELKVERLHSLGVVTVPEFGRRQWSGWSERRRVETILTLENLGQFFKIHALANIETWDLSRSQNEGLRFPTKNKKPSAVQGVHMNKRSFLLFAQ